jgi:hypothetical protein
MRGLNSLSLDADTISINSSRKILAAFVLNGER